MFWKSELPVEDLAYVADLPLSQVRRWAALRVLQPITRGQRRHWFHYTEAILACLIRRLQQFLGEKSSTPLSVAEALRSHIAGWLRPDPPHFVEPLVVKVPAHGVGLEIDLQYEDVAEMMARMDELTHRR